MKNVIRGLALATEYILFGLLTWTGYCLDFDLEESSADEIIRAAIQATQQHAISIVIISPVVVVLARGVRWWMREPSDEELTIEHLTTEALNKFRKAAFPNVPVSVPDDENRVTVFRHTSSCWRVRPWRSGFWPYGWGYLPWGGWLIGVARSGHVTKKSIAVFPAHDHREKVEGVAGAAWRRGSIRVRELPKLTGRRYPGLVSSLTFWAFSYLPNPSDQVREFVDLEKDVLTYSKGTFVSANEIRKRLRLRKSCPISMVGVLLRNSRRQPWGALVMDSMNQYECADTDDQQFKRALTTLDNSLRSFGILD